LVINDILHDSFIIDMILLLKLTFFFCNQTQADPQYNLVSKKMEFLSIDD